MINFDDSNFDIKSYSFFFGVKLLLGIKLVVCKFYLTFPRFHARVQIPTRSSYGKNLRKSIVTVLTPKSGITYVMTLLFTWAIEKIDIHILYAYSILNLSQVCWKYLKFPCF